MYFHVKIFAMKNIIFLNIKEGIVIWAKLKQGNGRGTCCWIIYILILFNSNFKYNK